MNIRKPSGNFEFEEDPFSKGAQGICKIFHEVLLLIKFLQSKPQIKGMNIKYYELYYTVIKKRVDKEIVDEQFDNNENDYFKFDDFIIPKHYIGRKMMMKYQGREK